MAEGYLVYVLESPSSKTYVGVTNNLPRRLRQHNGLLAGGAKYTRAGRPWTVAAHSSPLAKGVALSLEWYMHHWARRPRPRGLSGVEWRLEKVARVLALPKFRGVGFCRLAAPALDVGVGVVGGVEEGADGDLGVGDVPADVVRGVL